MVTDAINKALELGATITYGINWIWANGFPSKQAAEEFVAWLKEKGMDYRGVYTRPNEKKADVRFRD